MADEVWKLLDTVCKKLRGILEEVTTNEKSNGRPVRGSDFVEATVLGVTAFPVTIGYLQTAVFRPLRITSNKRVIGSVFGSLSVAISGCVASVLFVSYINLSRNITPRMFEFHKRDFDAYLPVIEYKSFKSSDILLYCAGSMAVFKAFGGRFRAVLPSSLIHPGSFARACIPANSQSYASHIAKEQLTRLGRRHGCHSCGKKRGRLFVGDHIPPNKLLKSGQKQHFFPQCSKCSSSQGAALSKNTHNMKHKLIKTHGTTLRLYHLWLPVPVGVMWLKTNR
ncbi:uncharacterized protein LOC110248478 [Exaiptasia diaphana]|uniref:Uncharacterized protein n=1 Tax=Exaiptasia diaphana TaxID=2652724 RepID=A0A913XVY9_EXADI|nr:uncharacterized protein LOC110248478 [Exaiptasia diaphana]KXJ08662.1 hypothetical protein AC249_AIPGENE4942 [Exaiptasia diaphana]